MAASSSLVEDGSIKQEQRGAGATTATTGATTRSWNDIDATLWLTSVGSMCIGGALLLHPLNIALARKRIAPPGMSIGTILLDLRKEPGGFRNLYRGLPASVGVHTLGGVTYFGVFEGSRELAKEHCSGRGVKEDIEDSSQFSTSSSFSSSDAVGGESSLFAGSGSSLNFGADAMGGVAADLTCLALCQPIGVTLTRQLTAGFALCSDRTYKPFPSTFKEVWKADRFKGLYAGGSAAVLSLPASGLWWGIYGELKRRFYGFAATDSSKTELDKARAWVYNNTASHSTWIRAAADSITSTTDNVAINATAGLLTSASITTIFNPLDVAQTQMAVLSTNSAAAGGKRPSILSVWRRVVKAEGVRGLWKGASTAVAMSSVEGVLMVSLYELTKLGSDTSMTVVSK